MAQRITLILILLELVLALTIVEASNNLPIEASNHNILTDLRKSDLAGGNSVIIASNPLQGLIEFITSLLNNNNKNTHGNKTSSNKTFSNGTFGNGTFSNGTFGNGTFSNSTFGNKP